ncbi:MAG: J domain-containing protein [Bacteroidota bacterium]|nr:J domain-containing protein [Candidatus Kapabacteria bacterium]MCS7302259.1 J domain-containing protein [Candidatus Kapabacteria bacterium]MCX7937324.1 J domain-containing protein [Chlorobiota bacterium]MDW8074879.1 J domain-containing protein [Bacteroidota bacterium]MDW8271518.1 J domain-containing protein [Bacteroidota bacterium]
MGILERILRILRAELSAGRSASSTSYATIEDEELRRIIEELHQPRTQPPPPRTSGIVEWAYRTLGVPPSATNAEIKAAYRRAIARVHPDRYASAPDQQRRWAEQRAQEINRAYAILKAVRNL